MTSAHSPTVSLLYFNRSLYHLVRTHSIWLHLNSWQFEPIVQRYEDLRASDTDKIAEFIIFIESEWKEDDNTIYFHSTKTYKCKEMI